MKFAGDGTVKDVAENAEKTESERERNLAVHKQHTCCYAEAESEGCHDIGRNAMFVSEACYAEKEIVLSCAQLV